MKPYHEQFKDTIDVVDGSAVIHEKEFKQIQFDAAVEGLTRFAWWKDGTQFVVSCGTTLKDAISELAKELEIKCTCGEPHISDKVIHRYDGSPCHLKPV